MQQYWQNLNSREQGMVVITGILILLYGLYWGIFLTTNHAVNSRLATLNEKKLTLDWMQKTQQQTTENTPKSVDESQLLTLVANDTNTPDFKKFPHQLQQTSQGDIQLTFEMVPYTLFLQWLWEFNHQYNIRIKQLTLDATETLGLVKVIAIITGKK